MGRSGRELSQWKKRDLIHPFLLSVELRVSCGLLPFTFSAPAKPIFPNDLCRREEERGELRAELACVQHLHARTLLYNCDTPRVRVKLRGQRRVHFKERGGREAGTDRIYSLHRSCGAIAIGRTGQRASVLMPGCASHVTSLTANIQRQSWRTMDTARELIYSEGRERKTSETNAVSHYSQGNSGGAPTLCTRPSVCHVPRRIAAAAAVSRERRTDGEINGETMQCASRAECRSSPFSLPLPQEHHLHVTSAKKSNH